MALLAIPIEQYPRLLIGVIARGETSLFPFWMDQGVDPYGPVKGLPNHFPLVVAVTKPEFCLPLVERALQLGERLRPENQAILAALGENLGRTPFSDDPEAPLLQCLDALARLGVSLRDLPAGALDSEKNDQGEPEGGFYARAAACPGLIEALLERGLDLRRTVDGWPFLFGYLRFLGLRDQLDHQAPRAVSANRSLAFEYRIPAEVQTVALVKRLLIQGVPANLAHKGESLLLLAAGLEQTGIASLLRHCQKITIAV